MQKQLDKNLRKQIEKLANLARQMDKKGQTLDLSFTDKKYGRKSYSNNTRKKYTKTKASEVREIAVTPELIELYTRGL
jgi:hypothetical protein